MSIRCLTPMDEINNYIDEQVNRLTYAIVRQMCIAGEMCVNAARGSHPNNWRNDTGNLRSSIGYVVIMDGKVVKLSDFQIVKQGKKGHDEGIDYANKLVSQFPESIILVVVAGMDYAYYVQRKRDVLDSAELKAEHIVPQLLKQLSI